MMIAQSKLTAQGQVSVPAEVRRKLGVGPGSVLEWDEEDEKIVIRRSARYNSEDIHHQIFSQKPKSRTTAELTEGILLQMRKRYGRS